MYSYASEENFPQSHSPDCKQNIKTHKEKRKILSGKIRASVLEFHEVTGVKTLSGWCCRGGRSQETPAERPVSHQEKERREGKEREGRK